MKTIFLKRFLASIINLTQSVKLRTYGLWSLVFGLAYI